MSTLISLSKEPLWPTSSTPDNNVVYNVTAVGRAGSGLLQVVLTASNLPPGVTVTFSPSVLKFTGNQLTAQTATMTFSCPSLMPTDCYAFTITATAQRESITITNEICFSASYLAIRPATLMLDSLTNGGLGGCRLRGLGATGTTYRIEATPTLNNPVWTVLGTATGDGNGRFTYFPTPAPGFPMRFFRSVTP